MCGLIFRKKTKKYSFSEAEEMRSRLDYLQNRLEKTRQLFDIETDPEKSRLSYMRKKLFLYG